MKLTKQAIAKLMDPVNRTVRIVNDAYREITATAKFNNYKIEIRVAVVHPLLQDKVTLFRGERVTMIYWVARSGDKVDEIPESLTPVIEDMRAAATMDRQEALNLCIGMQKFFDQHEQKVAPVEVKPVVAAEPSNVVEMKQSEATPAVNQQPIIVPETVERKPKRQYRSRSEPRPVWTSPAQRKLLEELKEGHEVPRTHYPSLLVLERKGLMKDIKMSTPQMDPVTHRVTVGFTAQIV